MRRVASSFSRNPKSGLLMFTSFCGRARTAEGAACTSVPVTRPVCLKLRGPAFRHPVPNAARALGYFWGREPKSTTHQSRLTTDHSLQVVRFTREGVHQGGFREREIRARYSPKESIRVVDSSRSTNSSTGTLCSVLDTTHECPAKSICTYK